MIKRKNYKNFLVMILTLILLFGCKTTPMISVEPQKSKSNDIEVQKNNSDDIEEQISKAKLVSTYGDMSTIDEMDTVTFGSYPQSSTSADKLEPIEWIVLFSKLFLNSMSPVISLMNSVVVVVFPLVPVISTEPIFKSFASSEIDS